MAGARHGSGDRVPCDGGCSHAAASRDAASAREPHGVHGPAAASPATLARIEEASLNALQTPLQLFYDGWLLRLSPGKAKRARSVNAHFGSTLPLSRKIAHCETVYAVRGLPALFRVTPFVHPPDLDRALDAEGFDRYEQTLVQALALRTPPQMPGMPPRVSVRTVDAGAFAEAVGAVRGTTAVERAAHRERLIGSAVAMRFVVVEDAGRVVCTAQLAAEEGIAGVFDVNTAHHARGQGHATRAVASLLTWAWEHAATVAYLQVSEDNAPALALYRKFGFATQYAYHYRARPGECA